MNNQDFRSQISYLTWFREFNTISEIRNVWNFECKFKTWAKFVIVAKWMAFALELGFDEDSVHSWDEWSGFQILDFTTELISWRINVWELNKKYQCETSKFTQSWRFIQDLFWNVSLNTRVMVLYWNPNLRIPNFDDVITVLFGDFVRFEDSALRFDILTLSWEYLRIFCLRFEIWESRFEFISLLNYDFCSWSLKVSRFQFGDILVPEFWNFILSEIWWLLDVWILLNLRSSILRVPKLLMFGLRFGIWENKSEMFLRFGLWVLTPSHFHFKDQLTFLIFKNEI